MATNYYIPCKDKSLLNKIMYSLYIYNILDKYDFFFLLKISTLPKIIKYGDNRFVYHIWFIIQFDRKYTAKTVYLYSRTTYTCGTWFLGM